MFKGVIDKIKAYDTIIIHRHIQPDLDALGSQFGLKNIIKKNFKGKAVYVVGDMNEFTLFGTMDDIEDDVFKDALIIVLDVAGKDRVSDNRFMLGKEKIVIDHHQNETDFADYFIHDPSQIATCQMLTQMVKDNNLTIDEEIATNLFGGLVTDSGRFLYHATTYKTFDAAAFLTQHGADIQSIYDVVYTEDYGTKKLKGYFINNFETTPHHVAYMKNDKRLKETFNVSGFTVSRGMVNQMAGIKGIPIWANFTESDNGDIQCELRSKEVPIVDIAKKYGGGGHALACGCTLSKWEHIDKVLKDLDQLAERINKDGS